MTNSNEDKKNAKMCAMRVPSLARNANTTRRRRRGKQSAQDDSYERPWRTCNLSLFETQSRLYPNTYSDFALRANVGLHCLALVAVASASCWVFNRPYLV